MSDSDTTGRSNADSLSTPTARRPASAIAPRLQPAPADEARAPTPATKVDLRNINFFYGKFQALHDITLPLYDRRVTAFIGPSGCGKSTLLRILNRIYELYPGQVATGEVLVDGENILAPGLDLNLLRDNRHGLSKADTLSDVDLRQHRLRHSPLRTPAAD